MRGESSQKKLRGNKGIGVSDWLDSRTRVLKAV
jgi:hypothetical protein